MNEVRNNRKLRHLAVSLLCAAALFCPLFCAPFYAGAAQKAIPEERQLPRLVDDADLLSEEEEDALLRKLDEISERQKCDVAIATVYSLGGKTPTAFADDFFDYNGYGMGPDDDGIILLLAMEDRDWAISTHSFAIRAFTDAGQSWIMEQVIPSLREGDYYGAFNDFADYSDQFLTSARNGEFYDRGNLPRSRITAEHALIYLAAGLAVAFLISLLVVSVMKAKHRTKRWRPGAESYMKKGSFQLLGSNEVFLFSHVDRTKRESDSGGGGSSTHSSSSGRSHGGSSGKF